MLRREITVVTPPAVEPVSVADLKAFARIDDDADDSFLSMLIETARVAAENFTNRYFIRRTLGLFLDAASDCRPFFPGYYELPVNYFDGCLPSEVHLPGGNVLSVASITTYDTQNIGTIYADSRYGVYGTRIQLNPGECWPSALRTARGTEIVFDAGYGDNPSDVPAPIRQAIMIHAGLLYETGGLCDSDCPPAGQQLLRPYKIWAL